MTLTVQNVIDKLFEPVKKLDKTVDTLKSGTPEQSVRKVGVTMTATYQAVEEAVRRGVDLLIVHEPTFYNHFDETSWLEGDRVYEAKLKLIKQSGMAIFRFHDYMHSYEPDAIMAGMLRQLEWSSYRDPNCENLVHLPETVPLSKLALGLKTKLGIEMLRYIGDRDLPCASVGFWPGAVGGRTQIDFLKNHPVDVLIVGETAEWETVEYMRDAVEAGFGQALLILGHQQSEAAGMRDLTDLLRRKFPEIEVEYISTEAPYKFM